MDIIVKRREVEEGEAKNEMKRKQGTFFVLPLWIQHSLFVSEKCVLQNNNEHNLTLSRIRTEM